MADHDPNSPLDAALKQKLIVACLNVAASRAATPALLKLFRLMTEDCAPKLGLPWPQERDIRDYFPARRISTDVSITVKDLP